MDIAYNRDWCLDMNHIALLHKQLLRLSTHSLDDRLGKQLLSVEPFNALIQIDTSYPTQPLVPAM